jgi:TonB family protein
MNLTTRLAASLLLATAMAGPLAMADDTPQPAQAHGGESPNTPPKFISGNDPKYTESARDAKIEGTVILAVSIDEKGKVKAVKVKSPLDKGLDHNAIKAVKRWKFQPATVDGKPVPTEVNISVDFRLMQ